MNAFYLILAFLKFNKSMIELLSLHPRETPLSYEWLFACAFSLLLLAVAYVRQDNLIRLVLIGFVSLQKEDSFNSESERMGPAIFWLLTSNFVVAASLALTFVLEKLFPSVHANPILAVVPFAFLIYWNAGQWVIFALVGKHPIIRQLKQHLRFSISLGGLFFLFAAIIFSLNQSLSNIAVAVIFTGFLLMNLNRIFKGVISALAMTIPWYYIFMYFCIVEILPLTATFVFYGDSLSAFVK